MKPQSTDQVAARNHHLTTAEFAKLNLVKPQSVIKRYCQTGSYFGVVPEKHANRRLMWQGTTPTQR